VRHRARLSSHTGGDLDLSTPKGLITAGWRRCGPSGKARSKARGSAKRQTGTRGRAGARAAGSAGPGAPENYANPEESDHRKRKIVGEELHPAEADALRDAARRMLDHGERSPSCGTETSAGSGCMTGW